MRDLYEVFNDLNLEEEKDLEVMNDLEKQKWKKKLRKEIKKPVKTGRKVAVSAGCLGIAAGLFLLLADSEVLAVATEVLPCGLEERRRKTIMSRKYMEKLPQTEERSPLWI